MKSYPLDLLLNYEYRFRSSIIGREFLNLALIHQFFSTYRDSKGESKLRDSVKTLSKVSEVITKELQFVYSILEERDENNNSKKGGHFKTEHKNLPQSIFEKYTLIVKLNNSLRKILKLMSFLQKKLKYSLEAFPAYFPSPNIFRARQELKFYQGLEDISLFYLKNTIAIANYQGNQLLKHLDDSIVSVYWETNDENSFFDPEDLFNYNEQNETFAIPFLFEGSFFIVNQPSLWIILSHEILHFIYVYLLHMIQHLTDSPLYINKVIDQTVNKIYPYLQQFGYCNQLYLRYLIVDIVVDSILTYIFGPTYYLAIWRMLFAYDEIPDSLVLLFRRAWLVRLTVPLLIYRDLGSQLSFMNIPAFEVKDFLSILEAIQKVSIEKSLKTKQAIIRSKIEKFIVLNLVSAIEDYIKKFKYPISEIFDNLENFSDMMETTKKILSQLNFKNYNLPKDYILKTFYFSFLNMKLSRLINEELLERSKNDNSANRLGEGRANAILFKLASNISSDKPIVSVDLKSRIDDFIRNSKDLHTILFSFVKIRFDGYPSDAYPHFNKILENFENNSKKSHFVYRNLGSFNYIFVDLMFRDKYANSTYLTKLLSYITKSSDKLSKQDIPNGVNSTLCLWNSLILDRILFYKNDLAATAIHMSPNNAFLKHDMSRYEDNKKHDRNNSLGYPSYDELKAFFNYTKKYPNIILQVSCNCGFSVDNFLSKLLQEVEENIPFLVCYSFGWCDYLILLSFSKVEDDNNFFYNSFKRIKKFLLDFSDENIIRTKTEVIFGPDVNDSVIIPAPEIILRLSNEIRNSDIKFDDILTEIKRLCTIENNTRLWNPFARPGIYDMVLRPNSEKIKYKNLLYLLDSIFCNENSLEESLRINIKKAKPWFSDIQIRFNLPLDSSSSS